MADGAARRQSFDTTMAYVDRVLYEAVFNSFYGNITLSFKAGKVVLLRKEETIVPNSANSEIVQPMLDGETSK